MTQANPRSRRCALRRVGGAPWPICVSLPRLGASGAALPDRRVHEGTTDFRAVQGTINAENVGSIVAGVLGAIPNSVYALSVDVPGFTRVASRRVAFWGGLFLIALALSPKVSALVAAIPGSVATAFLLMTLVNVFGHGMQMVHQDALGFEAGLAVCLGFWVGTGFQGGFLFNEMAPKWVQTFLSKGTTTGGLTTLSIMALPQLRRGASDRLAAPLEAGSEQRLRERVERVAARLSWDPRARDRRVLIAEEAFLFLLEEAMAHTPGRTGNFRVRLREAGGTWRRSSGARRPPATSRPPSATCPPTPYRPRMTNCRFACRGASRARCAICNTTALTTCSSAPIPVRPCPRPPEPAGPPSEVPEAAGVGSHPAGGRAIMSSRSSGLGKRRLGVMAKKLSRTSGIRARSTRIF